MEWTVNHGGIRGATVTSHAINADRDRHDSSAVTVHWQRYMFHTADKDYAWKHQLARHIQRAADDTRPCRAQCTYCICITLSLLPSRQKKSGKLPLIED